MIWRGVGFAITLGTFVAIWAILAVSLNLLVGYTGLLSVGHVGFFGIGAYTMAILTSDPAYEQLRTEALPIFAWPFFAVLPICMALAGLVAIVIGVVFNRFRDDIFVLASFGFAVIAFNVFLNWEGLTRGAFGIHQIARPAIGSWELDGEMEFLLLVVLFLGLVVLACWFIVTSSFGRVLAAIREDEAGYRRLRLPGGPLQAGDLGDLGHDGRPGRRPFRKLGPRSSIPTRSYCWSRSFWYPS